MRFKVKYFVTFLSFRIARKDTLSCLRVKFMLGDKFGSITKTTKHVNV